MMRRNEIRTNDKTVHDGCGDGGERFHIAGLPGWLRDRIESVAIPADRDQYFRDVVAALAGRGWDSLRITIAIRRPGVDSRVLRRPPARVGHQTGDRGAGLGPAPQHR
jgi:hypothetical protein